VKAGKQKLSEAGKEEWNERREEGME
jgi:hypothetical protein